MLASPERLGSRARALVEDEAHRLFLSAASAWEIGVKYSIGRLPLPATPEEYVPERMRLSGVEGIAVTHAHALRAGALEPHHRDPFDRLLIAQAQLEKMAIVTTDRAFEAYDAELVPAGS